LTQNLGLSDNSANLKPYIARGRYKKGDQYLICSDGLTDMVSQKEIQRIIKNNAFEDKVPLLLNAALKHGGKDNITIIMCKVLHNLFS
jgi:protein phosphatase